MAEMGGNVASIAYVAPAQCSHITPRSAKVADQPRNLAKSVRGIQ
jgi:hypothetical protein